MSDCPACGKGTLAQKTITHYADWLGQELPLRFSVCDHCGSELAGKEEINFNLRATKQARMQKDIKK